MRTKYQTIQERKLFISLPSHASELRNKAKYSYILVQRVNVDASRFLACVAFRGSRSISPFGCKDLQSLNILPWVTARAPLARPDKLNSCRKTSPAAISDRSQRCVLGAHMLASNSWQYCVTGREQHSSRPAGAIYMY